MRTSAKGGNISARKPVLALLIRVLWSSTLVLPVFEVHAGAILTTLHSFQFFPNGANPVAGLVQGSDGNFYGTTQSSGTNGSGTVFKISTNGVLTTLHYFGGGNDGANPDAGLVQGTDGYFYGTTGYGGTNDEGTVYKISTNGVLTSLYSFTGGNDGRDPEAGLVQGSDGYFYGTTYSGGTNNWGTVFKISSKGKLTSLYSFTSGYPDTRLVEGSDGFLYGTTSGGYSTGGKSYSGTVFKISTNGMFTNLYSFTGSVDGYSPNGLVQGSDGYFYGTTEIGGSNDWGTVFRISANGTLDGLYSFTGGDDGSRPFAALVQSSDGNFYGTTSAGGKYGSGYNGFGTVFRISTNGTLTSLYSFSGGNDGSQPYAELLQGADDNLYGTTYSGGVDSGGTVFETATNGVLTSLYSFAGETNDGAYPYAALLRGSDGNFYGTTAYGGAYGSSYDGYGTVFEVSSNGMFTNLYSFTGGDDGGGPNGLAQGNDGYFYGTTSGGGTHYSGTVFRISTNGTLTNLHSFTGGDDGANPYAGLRQGSDGDFYGTASAGGANNLGTVFKISVDGTFTSLHSFTGGTDGANPYAGLVHGSDGNFYGTASAGGTSNLGTVFKLSAGGTFTSLYSFTGGNDGAGPYAALVQGSDGNFYGTTSAGGTNNLGTVFKISSAGAFTSLYSFTGGSDGAIPNGLVQGSDGSLYGTTSGVGPGYGKYYGFGTVFKISTNGVFTSLYLFTGGSDGSIPSAGLVEGDGGYFYGTTSSWGGGEAGTVFRLLEVPDVPAFLAAIRVNSTLVLAWTTEAGWKYQLQYTSDLNSGHWTNFGGLVTATEPLLSASDSLTNGPQRFYRVKLSP